MADLNERVVGGAKTYVAPTITGLVDLLDQQVSDRPEAQALVLTGDRIPVSYGALAALVDDMAARLAQHGAAPRGRGRPDLCQHCRVRRRAPWGGTRRAGGRSAGSRAAPVGDVRPAREAGGTGDPRRPTRGRRRATGAVPRSDMGSCGSTSPPAGSRRRPSKSARVWCDTSGARQTSSRIDDALVLFTSGTTDQAKMVPLTHANVAASVRAICASLRAGSRRCDGRGHAALPRSRAARGAAVLPGQRRMRAAA